MRQCPKCKSGWLDESRSSEGIAVIEMDEMHTYIGLKKTTVGPGLLLIDMAKSLSIVLLAQEGVRLEKDFGKK